MDQNMELRQTILEISGVNPRKCMKCGKCTASCPAYDLMVIRQQGMNHMKSDDLPAFVNEDDSIPQQALVSAMRKYSK